MSCDVIVRPERIDGQEGATQSVSRCDKEYHPKRGKYNPFKYTTPFNTPLFIAVSKIFFGSFPHDGRQAN
jgi:hypothetical protein